MIASTGTLLGSWTQGPSMSVPRDGHTATVLKDGRVLVVGIGAEIFDPAANGWSAAGAPAINRTNHTATLLADGRVLVVGGIDNATGRSVPNAELYDPTTNRWAPAASMAGRRYDHTATLLADGRVLVTGGMRSTVTLDSAELYDPAQNRWTAAASLRTARTEHSATRLRDGRVLVVGGNGLPGLLASAEIYNPASDTWSTAEPMSEPRRVLPMTLLHDGRVLVAGGEATVLSTAAFAELFDPGTGFWLPAGLTTQPLIGDGLAMTTIADGRVLVCGGAPPENPLTSSAATYLYDPGADRWVPAGDMGQPRVYHSASLLTDGRVLIAGGRDEYSNGTSLTSTEVFEAGPPTTPTASAAPADASKPPAVPHTFPVLPLVAASIAALLVVALIAVSGLRRRRRRTTL